MATGFMVEKAQVRSRGRRREQMRGRKQKIADEKSRVEKGRRDKKRRRGGGREVIRREEEMERREDRRVEGKCDEIRRRNEKTEKNRRVKKER